MPISLTCPSCQHALHVPDAAAGSTTKCSACGGTVSIPARNGAASPPPAPTADWWSNVADPSAVKPLVPGGSSFPAVPAPTVISPAPPPVPLTPAAPVELLPASSEPNRSIWPAVTAITFGLLLLIGTPLALLFWMHRSTDTPTPAEPIASGPSTPTPPATVPSPSPPTGSTHGKVTGVPIFDRKFQSNQALDLELAGDLPRARYLVEEPPLVALPRLTEPKLMALTPNPTTISRAQMDQYNQIVDRFILWDIGRLRGPEGQKAVNDFNQLGLDSIPAVVRGVNISVGMDYSCPIMVLASRLSGMIQRCDDPDMLAYARDNLGRGVTHERYPGYLARLRAQCDARLRQLQVDMLRRLPTLIAGLKNEDPAIRRSCANALGSLGPRAASAVPNLIACLKDPDPEVPGHAARALVEIGPSSVQPLLGALRDKGTRNLAIAALTEPRPVPATTIDGLIGLLRDPDVEVRGAAHLALVRCGADAVPALRAALSSRPVRAEAALVLGHIGALAEPALPELVSALRDSETAYRVAAHHALVRMGKLAVPALSKAIADPDERVWYSATVALGKIGPAAAEAIPALTAMLTGKDKSKRVLAIGALAKIDPENRTVSQHLDEVLPTLIDVLQHDEASVRSWATECLVSLGSAARPAVPALTEALRDPSWSVRAKAAEALGRIGPEAREAIPQLVLVQKDATPDVRAAATTALTRIGPASLPALQTALKDANETARIGAAEALARIGQPALAGLIGTLKDAEPNARRTAALALQKIGPEARDATGPLTGAVKDADPTVRRQAVEALGAIDPGNPEAVQALVGALRDSQADVAAAARSILLKQKLDRTNVAVLVEALKDPNVSSRRVAGELLKGVGRDGSGAVPALLDALKDSDKQVRLHAAQALAEIDPAAPMVLPAVVDTLRDVDPEVRKAAQAALVKAGKPAVRQLAVALRSSAADQRIALAEVLQQMGDKAKDAVPVFLELVKDPDRQVRFKAILALRDIAPVSPPAVQVFLEGLRDSDEEVRVAAHIALLQKPKEIVPHLAAALKHKEVDVRRGVVETIKKIATEGHAPEELRTAVPGLVLTLRDPDEEVRTGAEWTLAAIDPQLKAALPVLLRAVHNPPKVATGKPLPAGANLTYVPTPRLVGALVQEKGAQLAEVLTELQCRRGEPVLVGLALAATLDDATVQPRALAAFQAYLGAEPPGELEEKQAAAKLSLAKNLVESGRPALARERYQDLVRAHPATRAAEEARELLSR